MFTGARELLKEGLHHYIFPGLLEINLTPSICILWAFHMPNVLTGPIHMVPIGLFLGRISLG